MGLFVEFVVLTPGTSRPARLTAELRGDLVMILSPRHPKRTSLTVMAASAGTGVLVNWCYRESNVSGYASPQPTIPSLDCANSCTSLAACPDPPPAMYHRLKSGALK